MKKRLIALAAGAAVAAAAAVPVGSAFAQPTSKCQRLGQQLSLATIQVERAFIAGISPRIIDVLITRELQLEAAFIAAGCEL